MDEGDSKGGRNGVSLSPGRAPRLALYYSEGERFYDLNAALGPSRAGADGVFWELVPLRAAESMTSPAIRSLC